MKYFNPSYWFKLWVLTAPLFNDKTQGINAKSIDNKKIKDWASKDITSLESIENQELTLSNNQTNLIQLQNDENIKSIKNFETDHFYENFLKTQGWSRDPQIAQQQLQEIEEEHHQFLKEQHNRIKKQVTPNPNNFHLDVRPIKQKNIWWCGPAIGESILRYFGLNVENFIRTNNQFSDIQSYLANRMITNPQRAEKSIQSNGGTTPDNWARAMNQIVQELNLNSGYSYSITNVNRHVTGWFNLMQNFPNLIRNSLENNTPVAIAFTGRLPHENQEHMHFVLITGFYFNSNNPNYPHPQIIERYFINYIDPWTGEMARLSEINFWNLFLNSQNPSQSDSFILSYNPPIMNNQIQDEPMEFGTFNNIINQINQNSINFAILIGTFFTRNLNNCNRRQARQITNNNYWHEKFCDLKPQIDKIQGKITAIKVLDENKNGSELTPGHLKSGDIYLGTTNGVYLIRDFFGSIRIEEFDDLVNNSISIKNVVIAKNCNAYALDNNNKIYYLYYRPGLGWFAENFYIKKSKQDCKGKCN